MHRWNKAFLYSNMIMFSNLRPEKLSATCLKMVMIIYLFRGECLPAPGSPNFLNTFQHQSSKADGVTSSPRVSSEDAKNSRDFFSFAKVSRATVSSYYFSSVSQWMKVRDLTLNLRGAGTEKADDDLTADDAVPAETLDEIREKFFQRHSVHGGIQELRAIPEDVPAGWDPDADWNLRIKSRQWWKERRDPSFFEKLPDTTRRLFHAIRIGAVPIVSLLLDELGGSAVNAAFDPETEKGRTCLHIAAYRGNLGTCRLLLARGAAVAAADQDGATPLHLAASYGRTDVCRELLDAGADPAAADAFNSTALDCAVDFKRQETARLLVDRGCPGGRHPAASAVADAEWIRDPLWPDGYKHDLLADSDEDQDSQGGSAPPRQTTPPSGR